MIKLISLLVTSLILFSFTAISRAETGFDPDDFEVNYSVFNSTFIKPDTASSYNIVRSFNRALVNIAVLKTVDNGTMPVRAKVSGSSSDLIRSTELDFREINEGKSIYYIAEFKFSHDEVRNFTIDVELENGMKLDTVKFSQRMYRDDR